MKPTWYHREAFSLPIRNEEIGAIMTAMLVAEQARKDDDHTGTKVSVGRKPSDGFVGVRSRLGYRHA